jgi:hypothetical protein
MTLTRPGRSASSSRRGRGAYALLLASLVGCASSKPPVNPSSPPVPVALTQLVPSVMLPGTLVILKGSNFDDTVTQTLHLSGSGSAGSVELDLPVKPTAPGRAEVATDEAVFASIGEGTFQGTALVVSRSAGGEVKGDPLDVTLQLVRRLSPKLTAVGTAKVYLNSKVPLDGDGFLLGGAEGQSLAELKGCFLPAGTTGPCDTVGRGVSIRIPIKPAADGDRKHGVFEFSPGIAGPRPGSLTATVAVIDVYPDAHQETSTTVTAPFQLEQTRLAALTPAAVSLGEYLDIRGAGFVGPPGSTLIRFTGTFTPKVGQPQDASFELVSAYQDGGLLRYVLEEDLGIGKVVSLRSAWGTLDGTWKPIVIWGSEQVEGVAATLKVQVAPVKQIVWVRFGTSWGETVMRFGLGAADAALRARVLAVLRRDYEGINVEFRTDEPTEFKLYAKVDLGGQDPNGLGLLGYDNTPGKDVGNKRLYDWLGGVNALTQQDGYPGYGGVFLESMLGFSTHPPAGIAKSPLADALFDQLFDPFRSDQGGKDLTVDEVAGMPALDSTDGCPAGGDRLTQAACAVRVLGNIVGSTASHEFGHSLGLAYPYGDPTDYHDHGDQPNRLMDAGGDRPFTERAELSGEGPAVFCDEEYDYLKKVLPLDPTKDPKVTRPSCY